MLQTKQTSVGDSWLGQLAFVLFTLFSITAIHLAYYVEIDYFDSFNFLLQARRITDPELNFIPFASYRPRTPVAILTGFDWLSLLMTGNYPPLLAYKLLYASHAIGFVLVWAYLIALLFGRKAGYATMILLCIAQIVIHYAPTLLSDIMAGFYWGLLLLAFYGTLQRFTRIKSSIRRQNGALLLGILGAFCGLTKNHLSLLWPSILVICYFSNRFTKLKFFAWKNERDFLKWSAVSLLSWALTLDLITRVFGHWGEGIWEHFRKIMEEASRQSLEATPRQIYIENFFDMYGPLFTVLSVLSVGNLVAFGKDCLPRTNTKRLITYCLFLAPLYALLTQWIAHREVRYMIPVMPSILAFLVVGAFHFYSLLGGLGKKIWFALWILALWHPLSRTINDVRTYYVDRIYRQDKSGSIGFYDYLKQPGSESMPCDKIISCRFALTSQRPFELTHDPYYRRYDIEPQLRFYTKKEVHPVHCETQPSPEKALDEILQKSNMSDPHACYIAIKSPDRTEHMPWVIAFRPASPGAAGSICPPGPNGTKQCYVYKAFFGT